MSVCSGAFGPNFAVRFTMLFPCTEASIEVLLVCLHQLGFVLYDVTKPHCQFITIIPSSSPRHRKGLTPLRPRTCPGLAQHGWQYLRDAQAVQVGLEKEGEGFETNMKMGCKF